MFARASVPYEFGAARKRNASSENFPVASRLLAPRVRGPVMAFYRFARAADDVADDPALGPGDRLVRLAAFAAALDGGPGAPEAGALRAALGPDGAAGLAQAHRLLEAFRMDAEGSSYATWTDLLGYCACSADPVGRFLTGLHGEAEATGALADPLCTALQVLNHLQDIREDRVRLGRIYLPADWLAAEGVVPDDLARDRATPGLRRVIDRALGGCEGLLARASALPAAIRDPGLRAQARATLGLAHGLAAALRRADPLAGRVAPGRLRVAGAVAGAALGRAAGA